MNTVFERGVSKFISESGEVLRAPIPLNDFSSINYVNILKQDASYDELVHFTKKLIVNLILTSLDQKVTNGQITGYTLEADKDLNYFVVFEDRDFACVRLVIDGPATKPEHPNKKFLRYAFFQEDIIEEKRTREFEVIKTVDYAKTQNK